MSWRPVLFSDSKIRWTLSSFCAVTETSARPSSTASSKAWTSTGVSSFAEAESRPVKYRYASPIPSALPAPAV